MVCWALIFHPFHQDDWGKPLLEENANIIQLERAIPFKLSWCFAGITREQHRSSASFCESCPPRQDSLKIGGVWCTGAFLNRSVSWNILWIYPVGSRLIPHFPLVYLRANASCKTRILNWQNTAQIEPAEIPGWERITIFAQYSSFAMQAGTHFENIWPSCCISTQVAPCFWMILFADWCKTITYKSMYK